MALSAIAPVMNYLAAPENILHPVCKLLLHFRAPSAHTQCPYSHFYLHLHLGVFKSCLLCAGNPGTSCIGVKRGIEGGETFRPQSVHTPVEHKPWSPRIRHKPRLRMARARKVLDPRNLFVTRSSHSRRLGHPRREREQR